MAKKRRNVDPEYKPNLRKELVWRDDEKKGAPHILKKKEISDHRREQLKLYQREYRAKIKSGKADPKVMERRKAEKDASAVKFHEYKRSHDRIKKLEKEVDKLKEDLEAQSHHEAALSLKEIAELKGKLALASQDYAREKKKNEELILVTVTLYATLNDFWSAYAKKLKPTIRAKDSKWQPPEEIKNLAKRIRDFHPKIQQFEGHLTGIGTAYKKVDNVSLRVVFH